MKTGKRFVVLALIVSLVVSLFSGCKAKEENVSGKKAATDTYPMTVTDQIGREVTIKEPVNSIVSTYYIATAITLALGCKDKLTGIEMKADKRELYKLAAKEIIDLPAVGSGKGINIEEIAKIAPDVVILPKKLKDSVKQLEALDFSVIIVDPETLDNYMDCVTLLAKVFGVASQGKKLNDYYQEKMEEVKKLTKDLKDKPKVYLSAGSSYYSTCTSKMYQNEMIQMAGGVNVSEKLTDSYWAQVDAERIMNWNPDVILCVNYAEYTLDDVRNDKALQDVAAVKNNSIYQIPSKIDPWDYPMPASALGILWLTHVLHNEVYSEEDFLKEAAYFYKTFFAIDVTKESMGIDF